MATYYVRPTNGSDAADGLSFANAFQTTQKAFDTAIGGDEIRLCNEATETLAASSTIDIDTNAGAYDNYIDVVAGDSTDGTPLTTGYYTISGASLGGTLDIFLLGQAAVWMNLTRVRLTAATQHGINTQTNGWMGQFTNCRFDTNTSAGVYVPDTAGYLRFIGCEFDSNTGQGIDVNAAARGNVVLVGCSVHDNGGIGAELGGDDGVVVVTNSEFYDNGGDGLQILADPTTGQSGGCGTVVNCTFYGNTGDGLYVAGGQANIHNNTSSGNTAYGFNFSAAGQEILRAEYNHTYNNTSGASNITLPGSNNQTGDPLFTSVTDGSEDFTPTATSPLKQNGISGKDIGARRALGLSNTDILIPTGPWR